MAIQLILSCFSGIFVQHIRQTIFFHVGKPKKIFFIWPTLYTDANEPLYNRIYIRGRTEMIYGRMGRKDFRPLAFESLLALTCGKKMSLLFRALHHTLILLSANGINIGCKIRGGSCDLWVEKLNGEREDSIICSTRKEWFC